MKKQSSDMTQGSIFKQIISFVIPIMISGVLQNLYNAADMVVVGKFAGKHYLASVGATGTPISLFLNIFLAFTSAITVVVAKKFGAGNKEGVSRAVHTSVAMCLFSGIGVAILGVCLSKPILLLMETPSDILDTATLYMRVFMIGVPASLMYNFGSAIMRAVGDSKRPTTYLALSGIVNVLLNLLFVIVFKMNVVGVALATIASQVLSAILVFRCLLKTQESHRLSPEKVKIHFSELREILFLGIPAAIQSSTFSISNAIIQASVNCLGSDCVAGNAAAVSIESIVFIAISAFFHASITFTGQNYGAGNFKRIRKGYILSMIIAFTCGVVVALPVVLFPEVFLKLYAQDAEVIKIGADRMRIVCSTYCLCALMEVAGGSLRGLGVAVRSMITAVFGVCGIRIAAVLMGTPYEKISDLNMLYFSYPVSWLVTTLVMTVLFFATVKSREKECNKETQKAVSD